MQVVAGASQKGVWKMKKFLIGLILALFLSGCAEVVKLREFTVADASLAQKWALEDGDQIAALCYGSLVEVGALLPVPKERQPIGALSGEYLLRALRRTVDANLDKDSIVLQKLRIGCGPLIMEKSDLALRLGLKFGF